MHSMTTKTNSEAIATEGRTDLRWPYREANGSLRKELGGRREDT
jgi:hypothetical protein